MKLADLPLNPTGRMLRQFAAAWTVFFAAAALYQFFKFGHHTTAAVLGALSLVGVIGLIQPPMVKWLFIVASVVTFPIGWVLSQVVLALMYYIVLTPIALAMRWRGRDELQRRPALDKRTFWHERGDVPSPEKYLKQF